jgi:CHAT domain-containing protein
MPPIAILLLFHIQASTVRAQTTAAEWLKAAQDLYQGGDRAASYRALETAVVQSMQEGDRGLEAAARFRIANILRSNGQYEASNDQLRTALALYEQLGERHKAGEVYTFLAANGSDMGRTAESRGYYEQAMAIFEALADWRAVAKLHHSLSFFTSGEQFNLHIQRGLELARRVGDRGIEAELLHSLADAEYAADDFDAAFGHLSQARSILEELRDKPRLAFVLTSIGRLYRVHGYPDQALPYYQRARDLQKQIGDVRGVVQSLNAMGTALNILGRSPEGLRYHEEGLRLARDSGSPLLIKFMLGAVASSRMALERNEEAASLLESAVRMQPPRLETLLLLSSVRYRLGQYEAARAAAAEAISLDGARGEKKRSALWHRARALWKLGKTEDALRDSRQLMDSVEEARRKLVPTDFMKQGFSNTDRDVTSLSIQILLDNHEDREALETAERARSRALLDLLATKNVRRDSASSANRSRAATTENAIALARRLHSTIVAYWVDDCTTIIWTVSPTGRIAHVRTETGAPTLEKWIHEALFPSANPGSSSRLQIASRSGEAMLVRQDSRAPWRQLYEALIRPVRSSLPSTPGSRLVIIPSGPLFRVSFAALTDEKGSYLIEQYALSYAPAMEVFQYTRQAQQRTASIPARYLLVANPSGMPAAGGKPLSALPWSENEVRSIFRLAPAGTATLLQGKQADEASVRKAMAAAKVIHLATHGVIDNNDPLKSFLALGRVGERPGMNGRLTAEEIYSIDLHADLVVLSACRTGLGRISGDGVAGLARAFFYAGAASVISTLWDVPDRPTARLTEEFYRSFPKSIGKSESLREAQLKLIRLLRNGEVTVATPFGTLPLPEAPELWAGFVLLGEP